LLVVARASFWLKVACIDYLDILLLHDIEFVELHQIVSESIPTLVKLKKQVHLQRALVTL
jgi:hypothetical protein